VIYGDNTVGSPWAVVLQLQLQYDDLPKRGRHTCL